MFRKTLAILILCSMIVHAMGRLGVIAYAYSHRSDIAFAIGLSSEKEIALCKSDHFQKTQLTSQSEGETSHPELAQAQEIQLFFHSSAIIRITVPFTLLPSFRYNFVPANYKTPSSDIFHPPGSRC